MQSVIVNGHNAKKIILLNCYRPPSGKPENAVDAIKNSLYQISNLERCEIVILGDLNLDYSDVNSDSYKLLNSIEDEFNLKQIIQNSTRIHRNGSSLIDVIFTNIRNIYSCGCIEYISDHLPTYIIKKRKNIIREKKYVYCRSYKNYDKNIFQSKLKNLDWTIFNLLDNVDDMWNMIYKAIEYEVNLMCPYKKTKITNNTYLSTFDNFPGVENARQLVSDILPIARGRYKYR